MCIRYLHVIKACLKVTTVMFYFCNSKNFLEAIQNAQFLLQKFVIFNMITGSFLVQKWGTLKFERR